MAETAYGIGEGPATRVSLSLSDVFPGQLAVQVRHAGTDLPAGTQVAISYDPRLYSPLPEVVPTVGDRRLRATSAVTTDPETSATTCTVTLTEGLPAHATTAVHHRNVSPTGRRSLQPGRPHTFGGVATPWGLEISCVWNRFEWANGKRWYHYPARITLSSVGPGAAPVAASFSVELDPQVVSDVRIVSARLNNKAYDVEVRLLSDTRTASLFETRWTTRVKLRSGDRLDLGLEVRTRKPTGDLPTVKHPTVG